MDPKTDYLRTLEGRAEAEKEAKERAQCWDLLVAVETANLAHEIANHLDQAHDLVPAEITPDLARRVAEFLANYVRQQREVLQRLAAAVAELDADEDTALAGMALRKALSLLPGEVKDDPALYMQTIGRIHRQAFCCSGSSTCQCPRCNPRRRA